MHHYVFLSSPNHGILSNCREHAHSRIMNLLHWQCCENDLKCVIMIKDSTHRALALNNGFLAI